MRWQGSVHDRASMLISISVLVLHHVSTDLTTYRQDRLSERKEAMQINCCIASFCVLPEEMCCFLKELALFPYEALLFSKEMLQNLTGCIS